MLLLITAGRFLGALAEFDSIFTLRRRLKQYAAPASLLIYEVGYALEARSSTVMQAQRNSTSI